MKTGLRRLEAIAELVAHDLAGLRLQIDQAGRPGEGAGPGENAFVGFPPPRFGRRAASQAIGQLPERRPIRIRLWLPPQPLVASRLTGRIHGLVVLAEELIALPLRKVLSCRRASRGVCQCLVGGFSAGLKPGRSVSWARRVGSGS